MTEDTDTPKRLRKIEAALERIREDQMEDRMRAGRIERTIAQLLADLAYLRGDLSHVRGDTTHLRHGLEPMIEAQRQAEERETDRAFEEIERRLREEGKL